MPAFVQSCWASICHPLSKCPFKIIEFQNEIDRSTIPYWGWFSRQIIFQHVSSAFFVESHPLQVEVLLTIVGALALGRALEQSCLAKCNLPAVLGPKSWGFCRVRWLHSMASSLFVFVVRDFFWHLVLIIYPHMRLFVKKSLAFSSIATHTAIQQA